MLGLALHVGKGPVTLADISADQGISLSYLEQLFAVLRSKQLVRGVRGPGGRLLPWQAVRVFNFLDAISLADLLQWGLADGAETDSGNQPVLGRKRAA